MNRIGKDAIKSSIVPFLVENGITEDMEHRKILDSYVRKYYVRERKDKDKKEMAIYSYRGSYKDIINKVRETDLKTISGPRIKEMVKMFDRIYSLHDGQLIGSEYMSVLDSGLKKYYDI